MKIISVVGAKPNFIKIAPFIHAIEKYNSALSPLAKGRCQGKECGGMTEGATPHLHQKEHGGASVLVGNNINRIREEYKIALQIGRIPQRPDLWDGNTAMRCVEAIVNY